MMKSAFLRVIRSKTLLLLALLSLCAMPLAGLTGPAPLPEGAAYCIAAEVRDADVLAERLEELGFSPAPGEAGLWTGIARGDWGCGLVLDGGEPRFLLAENAANPELWRGAAAAALFSVEAPYLTAEALRPAGIPAEEARARYDELYAAGSPFAITLVTVDGRAPEDTLVRDKVLMTGAAACLLGAVFAAAMPAWEDAALLRRRGYGPGVRAGVAASQLALRFLILAAAAALGTVLAGQGGLALRLVPYLFVCTLLAALALWLVRRPGAVAVAAALLCLLIPVLCPVYADLSLLAPRLAPVQKLFAPWWLFYGL